MDIKMLHSTQDYAIDECEKVNGVDENAEKFK